MKLNFCTLFDSNYIDKGIVMYESLIKNCKEFDLFILPMDKKCSYILKDLNCEKINILDYDDFEDDDLKRIKLERGRAEFCWTCTAKLVKYVQDKYKLEIVTYIDADLYFYSDPVVLIDEMVNEGKSVQIIEHNFRKFERREAERSAGRFCVEFNTFLNNQSAREVLLSWEKDCVQECSYGENDECMGDQKYLHYWPEKYDCINIINNQGAGVAPWNLNKFTYNLDDENHYRICDTESRKEYLLVFFHFQNIVYNTQNSVDCCMVDRRIRTSVEKIYKDYLMMICETKEMLEKKYGIRNDIKIHPAVEGKSTQKLSMKERARNMCNMGLLHMMRIILYKIKELYVWNRYLKYYEKLTIELEK